MINSITKTVHTQRSGILAGTHAHPRRHGDRRIDAFEPPINASVHQSAQIYQALVAENNLRRRAVQSEHADFHFRVTRSLPWFWEQELLNNSGLLAQGQ